MNRDTFVLIAFCVFALLVGMRIRQRLTARKQETAERINKNQRSKQARAMTEESEKTMVKRTGREKRIRFFTILQLVVLGGLMIYMIPALIRDFMLINSIDIPNLFLRCLIFICTIYVFVLGYIKVFGKKDKDISEKYQKEKDQGE